MELYLVATILDRDRAPGLLSIYEGLPLCLTMLGRGTARQEHLNLYGLQATEKAVVVTVADGEKVKRIIRAAKLKLFIDIPGNGIMMSIPVKSVGGGKTLAYLTDNAAPDGAKPEMRFDYELIMVVLNEGYTEMVMDAAWSGGAFGGTVMHAKGTGKDYAKKFLGVSLAEEKEVVLIVAESDKKAAIMRAITTTTGPDTPAGAITFSLPISSVAGLRSQFGQQ